MTIKINLAEILEEQNITLTQLSNEIDITLANLSILKTGKAKAIRFTTLEKICKALNCQPGDLIEHE